MVERGAGGEDPPLADVEGVEAGVFRPQPAKRHAQPERPSDLAHRVPALPYHRLP